MAVRSKVARVRGRARLGTLDVRLRPGMRVHVDPGSTTDVRGTLDLGCTYRGGPPYPGHLMLAAGARLVVEGDFRVHTGAQLWVNEGATLTLGSGYANAGLNLSCFSAITIGRDVMISENVTLRDSDNHRVSGSSSPSATAPIRIGDAVWIGLNAVVLKGVTIGDGAVVAAGAVVTRDVPARAMVAGVPARVVREDVTIE